MAPISMRSAQLAIGAVLGLAGALMPATAPAQDFPNRPIHIIIGYGPGSAADISARVIGQKMGKILGQQIIVEGRPGNGSNIATEVVARAPKDGYTLVMGNVANAVTAGITEHPTFDYEKELAPIVLMTAVPTLLAAHPSLGAHNLKELIAIAKQKPDQIFYASSGVGTAGHLGGALINVMAGIRLVHAPYQGSAQALTDLLAGRIQLTLSAASTTIPQVKDGKLVGIGMAQLKRSPAAPDIPTLSEQGLTGFDASLWFGIEAPAGTPRPIIDKLSQAMNEAIKSDEVIAPLRAQGIELLGGTPEEYVKYKHDAIAKWRSVGIAAGVKK
jgi:tripartite-type tricarboxylate transporter receptor subunit TctC